MAKIFVFITIILFSNAVIGQETVSSGRLDILREVPEDGFLRAITVRPFVFPADHGPHPGFRHEWWYATGNLDGPDGKQFGYELTFFRLALTPETDKEHKKEGSLWKTPLAFAAHFAITNVEENDFQFFHRYSRGDGRLSGANRNRVWLDDWFLKRIDTGWVLEAGEDDVSLKLNLIEEKPPILNGEQGLSRKSSTPGNATYYYTMPRLTSGGSLRLGDETFSVNGLTWLDREWGTSALSAKQKGWDWYALHLSDGSDLMFYHLRNIDGDRHPFSAGSWINVEGKKTNLNAENVEIEVLDYWESPLGGRYPSGWRIRYADKGIDITVTPMVKNQELDTLPRYWEGAVAITGSRNENPISGRGYVELTGYSE